MQTNIEPTVHVVSGKNQLRKAEIGDLPKNEVFLWDEHMIETLKEAFLQHTSPVTRMACKEIAEVHGWPPEIVEKKVNSLQLPRTKRYQREVQRRADARQDEEMHSNTLRRGPFVWRVSIDAPENTVSWLLNYAYGEFPQHFQNAEVFYQGSRYQVLRIHTQMLSVCSAPHSTSAASSSTCLDEA